MRRPTRAWRAHLLAVAGLLSSCTTTSPPPPLAPTLEAGDPDPARVEALVLLVGDAGTALPARSPLLRRVADDVEAWAPVLPAARTVVAYLGDLVYPWGVRAPDRPEHPRDTTHLHAQLEPILGSSAREHDATAWFLDGNHDWGHLPGDEGLARVRNGAAVVERWARAGLPVRFAPAPGSTGPEMVEVGEHHRILLLGTQAWLDATPALRQAATERLRAAMETPRTVVVLAHHPLQSAGEHGDDPPVETGFGLQYLASQAGLIRQDLSSRPYRDMVADAVEAGASGPPLVWAGGHDHTLQLLRGTGHGMPHWTVVSGSASKVGRLGSVPSLVAGGAWPGYARLFLLDDGTAHLQFVAAPGDAQHCDGASAHDLRACMAAGVEAYRTVVSRILRPRDP